MNRYLEFARIGLRESVVYRSDALASVATTVIYLVLMYSVWSAIAAAGTLEGSFSQVISYVALGQVVRNATSVDMENTIGEKVRKGTVVNELKRPVSFQLQMLSYQLGGSLFDTVARGVPAMAIAVVFLGVGSPGVLGGLEFLASVVLSFALVSLMSYSLAMLTFWTKVGWSLNMMRSTLTGLFSGALFPLYLLPDGVRGLFYLTPFPSLVDAPIRIYQGGLSGSVWGVYGVQVFWILFFAVASRLMWGKARTKLTVQGG